MTPHHAHHLQSVSDIVGHVKVHVAEVRVLVDGVVGARGARQVLQRVERRLAVHDDVRDARGHVWVRAAAGRAESHPGGRTCWTRVGRGCRPH